MPQYSYACTECGHRFTAHQAFTDESLTTCPECGGALRKLFSSVGVVFKGSGFYRTDSRSGSSSTVASSTTSDSGTGSSSTTPASTTSDSGSSTSTAKKPAAPASSPAA